MEQDNKTVGICSNLHGTVAFGLESGLLCLFGFCSVVWNSVYLKVLLSSGGHLPLTTKLLLINCSFASLGKSICYFLYFPLYNFVLLIVGFDPLAVNRTPCVFIASPFGVTTYALPVSMFFIACERMRSTLNKNLVQTDRVTLAQVISLISVWICAMCIYAGVTTIDSDLTAKTMCYCHFSMLIGPGASTLSNVVQIGMQVTNVVFYSFIYWKNKRNVFEITLNTARYSLTSRFIMWTNIKATKMLLPTTLLHACTNSTVTVVSRLLREAFNYKITDDYLCATIGVLCGMSLDALAHPILCLKFSHALADIATNFYPKLSWYLVKSDDQVEKKQTNCKEQEMVFVTTTNAPHLQQETLKSATTNNAQRSHLSRNVVEFRIKPEEHGDMLKDMWNKDHQRSRKGKPKNKISEQN